MSQKMKHSKVKNTGILFELVTRQITADLLNNNKDSRAIDLIKKYFKEDTEMGREHELYRILLSENYTSANRAEKLIEAVIKTIPL